MIGKATLTETTQIVNIIIKLNNYYFLCNIYQVYPNS